MTETMANDRRLPAVKVAKRYGICTKTINRWLAREELEFPQPLVINHLRYWSLQELQAWERKQAAATANLETYRRHMAAMRQSRGARK